MEITHEVLFNRIRERPLDHLGCASPDFLQPYFWGYDLARAFHRQLPVKGHLDLRNFESWFGQKISGARQGFAAYCRLLTESHQDALELFFELRKLCLNEVPPSTRLLDQGLHATPDDKPLSMTDLTLCKNIRERPALYFGGGPKVRKLWATWNGWIWAETDLGIGDSSDRQNFTGFQIWVDEKYSFTSKPNWGKVMDYLGMGNGEKGYEQFYDHFESYLAGIGPGEPTIKCQHWIDEVVKDVKDRQAKGEL